jgi:hypothetical protein
MDWRVEVLQAVEYWLRKEERVGSTAGGWRQIGRARPTGEEGWYSVDARRVKVDPEQLEQLCMAGPTAPGSAGGGSGSVGWSVQEALLEGGTLRVRVAGIAAVDDPHVWFLRQPSGFLVQALRNRLEKLTSAGLAEVLARGRLQGTPAPDLPGATPPGLLPGQAAAYRAASGSGVWLVWGPPGTGKTQVLRYAIDNLLERGKRVLLVSATNIAVDNALHRVIADNHGLRPGRIVRVGTPQLPDIQRNEAVSLPHLVRVRLEHVERQRAALEEKIKPLREQAKKLAAYEERLSGFDHAGYLEAARIIGDDPDRIHAELDAAANGAARALELAGAACHDAEALAARALAEHEATATARGVWLQVDELNRRIAATEAAAVAKEAAALAGTGRLTLCREQLAAWTSQSAFKRLRSGSTRDRLAETLRVAEADALVAGRTAADARRTADAFRANTNSTVSALARQAGMSRAEIGRRNAVSWEAAAAHAAAEVRADEAARAEAMARTALDGFLAAASVLRAEAQRVDDRPAMAAYAARLRPCAEGDRATLERLCADYLKVDREYAKLASDAAGEIIGAAQLVATTLARFRMSGAVFDGSYDAVFVDEVSSATLPEVLLAVSKADSMAMLLGDFMQLGAVGVDQLVGRDSPPSVGTWLVPDVFEHCGIKTPIQAEQHPFCITLDVQHRFGLDLMELANRVAYDGLLRAGQRATGLGRGTVEDPQVVLVDTDGLGDLERIYLAPGKKQSGWWPAGTLLSRAIADTHIRRGEATGIVAPYTPQAEATLEALLDLEHGGDAIAEVGTAHRFQGREFPIVVFDTVESGLRGGRGWVADASVAGTSFQRDGVRLFNVAATRAQQTLYILAGRTVVERARPGTPLAHLRRQIAEGHASVVRAVDFIQPGNQIPEEYGALGAELAETLSRHVEVLALDDERSFYNGFLPRIRAARESIWLWAPWAAKRVRLVLPELADAQERGVRVVVFVRGPGDALHKENPDFGDELRRVLRNVVLIKSMHQKIAVFDEQVVLYGSLNMLSSSLNPQEQNRETMMTLNGQALARKILQAEHAEELSRPVRCEGCGGVLGEIRVYKSQPGRWWNCLNPDCPKRLGNNRSWQQQVVP